MPNTVEFRAENIQQHLTHTRHQMILFALVVGSDYTQDRTPGRRYGDCARGARLLPPDDDTSVRFPPHNPRAVAHRFAGVSRPAIGREDVSQRRSQGEAAQREAVGYFPNRKEVGAFLELRTLHVSQLNLVGLVDFAREKFGRCRRKSDVIMRPVVS